MKRVIATTGAAAMFGTYSRATPSRLTTRCLTRSHILGGTPHACSATTNQAEFGQEATDALDPDSTSHIK